MIELRSLLLVFLLSCHHFFASNITSLTFSDVDRGWNSDSLAKMYFHNSETQRQWAWESLSQVSFSGNEKILDFGCGDGKISAEMARLAKNGTVLGVDVSKKMIHLAKIYFPSYAFPNLTFLNSKSLQLNDIQGSQDFDLVTAFSVFHLISDPLDILKTLKSHLKPSGKLLIVTPTGKNEALLQAANETFIKYGIETPWHQNPPLNNPSMRTVVGCSTLLKEAGLLVESIKIVDTDNPFYDPDDFIDWLVGTATATWQIPLSMSRVFFSDLVHRMIVIDPMIIDSEGRFCFKMPRLHALTTPNLQSK